MLPNSCTCFSSFFSFTTRILKHTIRFHLTRRFFLNFLYLYIYIEGRIHVIGIFVFLRWNTRTRIDARCSYQAKPRRIAFRGPRATYIKATIIPSPWVRTRHAANIIVVLLFPAIIISGCCIVTRTSVGQWDIASSWCRRRLGTHENARIY